MSQGFKISKNVLNSENNYPAIGTFKSLTAVFKEI
jgi:hypothetical protein